MMEQNQPKESMDEGQIHTPIGVSLQVDNPSGSEPLPPPQPSGDGLNASSRSITGESTISDKPMESISSESSLHRPWLADSVQGNVTESMPMVGEILEHANDRADWTLAFTNNVQWIPANLTKWIVIVSEEHAEAIDNSIRNMMKTSWPNKWQILAFQIVKLKENLILPYLQNMDNALQHEKDFQMLFIILSNNSQELHCALTDRLKSVDLPVVYTNANDALSKGLLSITIESITGLHKKFGWEAKPWCNVVPLLNTMIIGFDVYKPKGSNISTAGMVFTVSDSYFSITFNHQTEEELSRNFNINMKKCCNDYKLLMGNLPYRIIIFRCGVVSDYLGYIKMLEVEQIVTVLQEVYWAEKKQIPKLTYIVVANKISSSMLSEVMYAGPGIASQISFFQTNIPLRYHFFLVSKIPQKVVKPTSFFVLHDTQGFLPEQIQMIINQMCHFNFDPSGVVVVPVPCMLAYKLAFLTGISGGKQVHIDPEHNVIFL